MGVANWDCTLTFVKPLALQTEMKFKSTRGLGGVSFEEAVLSGCASDGGMFMPEIIPTISREQMKTWATLTYPQVVEKVMRMCVDQEELSDQEILGTVMIISLLGECRALWGELAKRAAFPSHEVLTL